MIGLQGFFFSPGKSVFLYAPVSLAGLVFLVHVWRSSRKGVRLLFDPGVTAAASAILCITLPLSMWYGWDGDAAWGPRMIFLILPVLHLPLVFWGGSVMQGKGGNYIWFFRRVIVALALLGFVIQLPALAVGARPLSIAGVTFNQMINPPDEGVAGQDYVPRVQDFDASFSPLLWQFRILPQMARLDGGIDLPVTAGAPGKKPQRLVFEMLTPDFWFWKSGERLPDVAGVLGAILLLFAGIFLLRRTWSSLADDLG